MYQVQGIDFNYIRTISSFWPADCGSEIWIPESVTSINIYCCTPLKWIVYYMFLLTSVLLQTCQLFHAVVPSPKFCIWFCKKMTNILQNVAIFLCSSPCHQRMSPWIRECYRTSKPGWSLHIAADNTVCASTMIQQKLKRLTCGFQCWILMFSVGNALILGSDTAPQDQFPHFETLSSDCNK